jgi:uncharacterized protein YdeI (YjbR/CyaY-like superfamily)
MTETNPKVDAYLRRADKWQEEMTQLRKIILDVDLKEELKWGKPCYSFDGSNVVIIIAFKESCALMFCKGALLKDAKRLLLQPTENTQAGRWIKFTSTVEITRRKAAVRAYLQEAIAAEKAGLKVVYKTVTDFKMPVEFQNKLDAVPALKKAFGTLTPGRQRGYQLYFSSAKQSKTREARVEKCTPRILSGKGLLDD